MSIVSKNINRKRTKTNLDSIALVLSKIEDGDYKQKLAFKTKLCYVTVARVINWLEALKIIERAVKTNTGGKIRSIIIKNRDATGIAREYLTAKKGFQKYLEERDNSIIPLFYFLCYTKIICIYPLLFRLTMKKKDCLKL